MDDFTLDLDQESIAKVNPNEGGSFKRVMFGDYRFKIVDIEQKAKQGEKPHVMLKPTFVITAAHDPANAAEVGAQIDGLYAGSQQSPKFMQERLACLIRACAIQLKPGQKLAGSHFVGREFDATIVWEKGKPTFDETTGQQKVYVNARVIGERPLGQPRSPGIDPARASAEAVKYLEETYGDAGTGSTAPAADAPPWEKPADAAAPTTIPVASGFRPEAEADAAVHEYRAYIKLDTPWKDQARAGLISAGFDPDGPVDRTQLAVKPELLAQWDAKFPAGNGASTGLPPLGGNPPGAKTGTRSKSK